MKESTKFINYARDDVFIISVNKSADMIEECEAKLYLNPNNIFAYYGLVSALYSKIHRYISKSEDLEKELKNIRKELFSNRILDEIKHNNISPNVKKKFLSIFDKVVKVYRSITSDLPDTSIFPLVNISRERKINENLRQND